MAKIHVISRHARLYPIAHRLLFEGHEVTYFADPSYQPAMLWDPNNPPTRFEPPTDAADFYVVDPRGLGGFGDALVRERKVLVGGSRLTMKLEQQNGDRAKLVQHLLPSVGSGVVSTPAVAIGMFNGEKWLEPQVIALYQSRLMEGERGPHLGYTGTALLPISERFAEHAFSPQLTEFLSQAQYKGPVHIFMGVGPEALLFYDLDVSLTPPFLPLWQELSRTPLYETLFGLSTGMLKHIKWREHQAALGVRMSFTPPVSEEADEELLRPGDYKHLWPEVGNTPPVLYLAWVTARGEDLQEARRRVNRTIQMTQPVAQVQYRRDIGSVLDRQVQDMKGWGWM